MLEIVPPGISKGSGAKLLLDHLGITEKEVMNTIFSIWACCYLYSICIRFFCV